MNNDLVTVVIVDCVSCYSSLDKWMACQSMDNQIMIFGCLNRFRQNRKKTFKGHMVRCLLPFVIGFVNP